MDGFFGIGIWEILLIFAVILMLLGPRRLPEIAARLGTFYRRLKRASFDLTSQLSREVEGSPGDKSEDSLHSLKQAASDLKSSLSTAVEEARASRAQEPQEDDQKPQAQA